MTPDILELSTELGKIPPGPREFSFVLGPGKARLPDHVASW